jgi:hypothetical protein
MIVVMPNGFATKAGEKAAKGKGGGKGRAPCLVDGNGHNTAEMSNSLYHFAQRIFKD